MKLFSGPDVSDVVWGRLPPLQPDNPPRPQAPERPDIRVRAAQAGRLWACAGLRLSDGSYTSGRIWAQIHHAHTVKN